MTLKAFITGVAGTSLSSAERSFLAEVRPCGLIIFDRNIEDRDQLRDLVADYREAVGSTTQLVLIDQEGGRIQRMRQPHWRKWPAAARYGELYERNKETAIKAARLVYHMMAKELTDVGINVNCVPLLDIPISGAHDIIGDRALSSDINAIIELGWAVANGNLAGGVLPVIKHIPGHGRATVDSHESLPVIDTKRDEMEKTDFRTFRALNDLPLAMTGHLLLNDLDPHNNVSVSVKIIDEIIRDWIGFDGLLMSDDLSMEALSGTIGERGCDVIAAGCDIALYCKGVFSEMQDVANSVPNLQGKALERFKNAFELIAEPSSFDVEDGEKILELLDH